MPPKGGKKQISRAMRATYMYALLPALGGSLFTFYNTLKADQRNHTISRINDQVKDFYGPLLACITASKSSYDAMIRQHSPDGTVSGFVAAIRENPEGVEGCMYRDWVMTVLQPLNEKAADTIINNLNLLESPSSGKPIVPPSLLKFVAHVSSLRVVIEQWRKGNVGEWSVVSYPNDLLDIVSEDFRRITRKQQKLLGISSPTICWKRLVGMLSVPGTRLHSRL